MILVRKNVYKDVCLFENVFNVCKMFGNVCVCFENRKDSFFEMKQATRSNLPAQNVFLVLFHLSFWIKEKSVETLANRNICDQTQNLQVSSPTISHQASILRSHSQPLDHPLIQI